MTLPRSVRDNNPGDLEIGIAWDGLSTITSDNPFCVFVSPVWGFRALAIDLHTKWAVDGLRTITAIITKFAPPSENPTAAYIRAVSISMGTSPDVTLNLNDFAQLRSMCKAMATFEAGSWMFSPKHLSRGVGMALAYVNPAVA